MPKPNIMAQLQAQVGMGRPGGMASRGSAPNVMSGPGSKFTGMENAMLKKLKPNPRKLAMGKKTRQFKKIAAEENQL